MLAAAGSGAHEASAIALVSGNSYGLGTVRYDDDSGHCYECIAPDGALGSEITDDTKWRALPLLYLLLEPTLALAEARKINKEIYGLMFNDQLLERRVEFAVKQTDKGPRAMAVRPHR